MLSGSANRFPFIGKVGKSEKDSGFVGADGSMTISETTEPSSDIGGDAIVGVLIGCKGLSSQAPGGAVDFESVLDL